jgi:hypothetical protein
MGSRMVVKFWQQFHNFDDDEKKTPQLFDMIGEAIKIQIS